MNNPFFTVVIPTHNRAKFLREALRSVLDQTFRDFDIIVIDDHSTDNTKEVVTSFRDNRIQYIINDRNRGGAGTRNAGIYMAKGEWIAFLDDDDVWLPHKLEVIYKRIETIDHITSLVYTGFAFYDFDKYELISDHLPCKEGWIQNDLLNDNYIGTFSAVIIRKDILLNVGGLDERFESMQDMELYVRISGITKIVSVKDILTYVRCSNTDRITLNSQKKLNSSILFWEKHKNIMNARLRNRSAARVFIYAFKENNKKYMCKALPWTIAGLFVNVHQFLKTIWAVYNVISLRVRDSSEVNYG